MSTRIFDLLGEGGNENSNGVVYILKEVSVPESASLLGLLAIAGFGMTLVLKKKKD